MTKEQERARARQQQAKYETRQEQRAADQTRNRQVVGVVVAVLAVIAVFVGVSTQLGDDDEGSTPASSQTAPDDVQTEDAPTDPSADPSSTEPVQLDGCEEAPAAPGEAKQLELPDAALAEGKMFTAKVTTNCGDIVFDLDGTKAPQTVASFINLSKEGYFDDSPCPRVTTDGLFVLQCGDPTGTTSGGPGYGFGIENAPADGKYPAGTLAMARSQDPNSNGSQFFIVYQDTELPTDGGGYSIFGTVTQGLDIVEKVAGAGSDNSNAAGGGKPLAPISILTVAVTEK